jgi:general secretion pathway protein C
MGRRLFAGWWTKPLNHNRRMTARLMSLLIWAAVLATAAYWGLRLFTRATPVPENAVVATAAAPSGASLARLLGTPPPQPVAEAAPVVVDSRFRLLGVVAPRPGQASGLALISVDGKPARAVAVGREIEPGLRVLTVGHRQVELGAMRGTPGITLALPPVAEASRGRLGEAAMVPLPGMPQAGQSGVMLRLPPPPGALPGPLPIPGQIPGQMAQPGVAMPQGDGALPETPTDGNGLATR